MDSGGVDPVRTCRICLVEFVPESEIDPSEPCWCGQMADCSPWRWDRWAGVRNAIAYRLRWAWIKLRYRA